MKSCFPHLHWMLLLVVTLASAGCIDEPAVRTEALWRAETGVMVESALSSANLMATSAEGHVYVSGRKFTDPTQPTVASIILEKYSAQGEFLWSRIYDNILGPGEGDVSGSILVGAQGNVFLAGKVSNLVSPYETDIVLVKYDPNGNLLWERRFHPSYPQTLGSVTTDSPLFMFVADNGNITIVLQSLYYEKINGESFEFQLAAIYDPNGNLLQEINLAELRSQRLRFVTANSAGALIGSNGGNAVVKYNNLGVLEWSVPLVYPVDSLVLDHNENVIATTIISGPKFSTTVVNKISAAGVLLWQTRIENTIVTSRSFHTGRRPVAVDSFDDIYLFYTLATNVFNVAADESIVIAKFSAAGKLMWESRPVYESTYAGRFSDGTPSKLYLDSQNRVYITQTIKQPYSQDTFAFVYQPDGRDFFTINEYRSILSWGGIDAQDNFLAFTNDLMFPSYPPLGTLIKYNIDQLSAAAP